MHWTDAEGIRKAYESKGYVLIERLLDENELAAMRLASDELIEKSRSVTRNDAVYDLEDDHSASTPRVRRVKAPNLHHPRFREFMQHPRLLAVLEPLLGPNIRHQYVKLNVKTGDGGSPLEWHQDWAFYPHTNSSVLAVGLMLDDVTEEKGPTLVVPESHRPFVVHDHTRDGYFAGAMDPKDPGVDFSRAVGLTAPAGSITVHHAFLVHGAARNLASSMRRICFYEFMAADAWPLDGIYPPDVREALGDFDSRIVHGSSTVYPRLEAVPARMPLPKAREKYDSIYRAQEALSDRFFR